MTRRHTALPYGAPMGRGRVRVHVSVNSGVLSLFRLFFGLLGGTQQMELVTAIIVLIKTIISCKGTYQKSSKMHKKPERRLGLHYYVAM